MATIELSLLKEQTQKLLPKQKVELIKYLSDSLSREQHGLPAAFLKFGKYSHSGLRASEDEDFKIAEWHPTQEELNGD